MLKSALRSSPKFNRDKTFKHNFVEFKDIKSFMKDGKRYYTTPDDVSYPSVTSVLGAKKDKTHLNEWIKRVGADEAEKIKVQAGNRGTAIHTIAEHYVLNEDHYPNGVMPANVMTFKCIKPVLDKHVDNIYAVEAPLYSHKLKTAGRTDCIAEFDGTLSIIDFKTSLKPKKEEWITDYFLQATCYSMMAEELIDLVIPQIAIIIAVDGQPEAQVFVIKKTQFVDKVLEVFNGDVK